MKTKQLNQPDPKLDTPQITGRKACPRYSGCRAHICPNDPIRRLGWPKKGENVCYFTRETNKVAKVNTEGRSKPDKRQHANESRRIVSRTQAAQIKQMTGTEYFEKFFGEDSA
ncbi:MAG: hypothetical protein ACI9UU_002416 [Candidatus Azotimanducaceae bacterium]